MAETTTTPAVTPVINPAETPWPERHVKPNEICPQQHRELASPDIEPQMLRDNLVLVSRGTISHADTSPGRRFRVFALVATTQELAVPAGILTMREAYEVAKADPTVASMFKGLSMRSGGCGYYDPQLPEWLQDLGWMIGHDLTEACAAFDDPDCWYPGVDDGIEPVPDELIARVIAGTMRELERETPRLGRGVRTAPPLAHLPWRIQRAFVERRRLRYKQWGIGREQSWAA